MEAAEELISHVMHQNWLSNLVEKRDMWLSRASGRRISEELDRVQLFERDLLITEVLVRDGNIENAKSEALMHAIERDRIQDRRA